MSVAKAKSATSAKSYKPRRCKVCRELFAPVGSGAHRRVRCDACVARADAAVTRGLPKLPDIEDRIARLSARAAQGLPLFETERGESC